jgi:hypothetical protein
MQARVNDLNGAAQPERSRTDRRTTIRWLLGSAFAAQLTAPRAAKSAARQSADLSKCLDIPKFTLNDVRVIFPNIKIRNAPTVLAYYYPSWHRDPAHAAMVHRDASWTEWDLLSSTKPSYPCQAQPKIPYNSMSDLSLTALVTQDIALAQGAHVNGFVFDWYCNGGNRFCERPIHTFLSAIRDAPDFKFSLLWVNHDSAEWKFDYEKYDIEKMMGIFTSEYANHSNYLQIDGRPVFGIFDVNAIKAALGVPGVTAFVKKIRDAAAASGIPGLYLIAVHVYDADDDLRAIGFDAATSYHAFAMYRPGEESYRDAALRAVKTWVWRRNRLTVPFIPDCPVGWDDSPRRGSEAHVVVNRSADQYGALVTAARVFGSMTPLPGLILLSSWNEWTEDHYLLPDQKFGTTYLNSLASAIS